MLARNAEGQGWLDRLRGRKSSPRAPQGMRLYAVGDIHGRDDLLEQLLASIADHARDRHEQNGLIFLGDYVDRGPQSRQVIERLLHLDLQGWDVVFLRGNHDQAVLDFLDDPGFYEVWRGFGAAETLLSYGVTPPRFDNPREFREARDAFAAKCPPEHLEFLKGLKYSKIFGDYVFVHAGLRPGVSIERQVEEDLLWIRDDFLTSDHSFGKIVVHGHTPANRPVRRPNRIGIDTGAYATGCLTAVILEGEECSFLSTLETTEAS